MTRVVAVGAVGAAAAVGGGGGGLEAGGEARGWLQRVGSQVDRGAAVAVDAPVVV